MIFQVLFSQQYDTVVIEEEDVDVNNEIYKIGNVFVYDYEIIKEGITKKLKKFLKTPFTFGGKSQKRLMIKKS